MHMQGYCRASTRIIELVEGMSKGNLIVICQSGGQFVTNIDGSLSYTGGEAHAIDVDPETKFGDFKTELVDIWKCNASSISIKYLLPSNKRTLITVSNEKDLHRMINYHAGLETADVYVSIGESVARDIPNTFIAHDVPDTFVTPDVPSTLASRTSATSVSEPVSPIVSHEAAVDNVGQQRCTIVWKNIITGVGQQFNSRQELRDALGKFAIAHSFGLKYTNSGKFVTAKCNAKGCTWRIHASSISKTEIYRVKTYNKLHTCEGGIGASGHPQASKSFVADIIKKKLGGNPHYKPMDIVNDIQRDYGVKLSYFKAWRAKEIAREHLQGSYAESYNQLPWYCEKILETNPGSIAVVTTFDDLRFRSLFISFDASRHGFEDGCRPLIFLDGIVLGSKLKGTLLVAAAVDGDDNIFPVAYAVIDVETEDNWRWFLVQLRSVVSRDRTITFVFSKRSGVKESLSEVFEDSHQAYCLRHLTEDFVKELKEEFTVETKRAMASDIYGAAQAPLLEDFKNFLEKIRSISQEAFNWVIDSKPEHWANAFFRGERYNHLTPNIEELFTNWISERPDLPILQTIDEIRCKIMELINRRREDSNRWLTRLTPSMEEKLQIDMLEARCLGVVCSSDTKFEVRDQFINSVDIELWECSCKVWQVSGMPCLHAIAVFDRIGRSAYDYCRRYFTAECYRLTYLKSINPVPNIERPMQTDSSQVTVQVLPPSTRRSPGRPRKRRIRSKDIIRRSLHCSRCKEVGHNRSTCKEAID